VSNSPSHTINRRKFLKLAGATLAVSAATCGGLGTLATRQPQIDFVENHYPGENNMKQRILVAYASKAGSTGEVAGAIGQALAVNGATVDVYPVEAVPNIQDYQAVIVGSAIRAGRWLAVATRFVETHRSYLSHIPTAYFTCCMTLSEETEENRRRALGYMDPARRMVTPLTVGAFAGKLDYSKLSFLDGLMMRVMGGGIEGDFRPWEAIRAWANTLRPTLIG
jgi:menaquinone-dependent protoporphyrinogen oxidase